MGAFGRDKKAKKGKGGGESGPHTFAHFDGHGADAGVDQLVVGTGVVGTLGQKLPEEEPGPQRVAACCQAGRGWVELDREGC